MTGFVLKDAEDDGSFDLLTFCAAATLDVCGHLHAAHRSSALYRGYISCVCVCLKPTGTPKQTC